MLVPSLSFAEIVQHFERDFPFVQHKTAAHRDGVLREFLNSPLERSTRAVEMTAPSHNRWLVFYMMTRKPRTILAFHILYYDDDSGIHTIKKLEAGTVACIEDGYMRQDGHFYHRYNTRLSLGITKPIEVVKHFHKHNGQFVDKKDDKKNEDGSVNIFAAIPSGIMLGTLYPKEKYSLYKTFLAETMLHQSQKELSDFMRNPSIQAELWGRHNKLPTNP